MNPIRHAGVIAFIDWISRSHPEVLSLRDTPKEKFLSLATEYEASRGLKIDKDHNVFRKWESTQGVFSDSGSDEQALERLQQLA